ncbi:MAG: YaaR family protein [Clostridiales bacterium]|nr:YaaR family protein [Clostridiales bacterium]
MELKISATNAATPFETPPRAEFSSGDRFSFTLDRLAEEGVAERVRALVDEITAIGENISERMDIRRLKDYRFKISEFINEVVTHSREFARENFLDSRGRHRVFGIVRLIDEKLDELARELIKKEKDRLLILEKTDEIRGLVMDILA